MVIFFAEKACVSAAVMILFPRPQRERTKTKVKGVLAQLVERLNGIEEVSGSNPLCSTK